MRKKELLGPPMLTADFFVENYRISAQVDTRARTLGDILNDTLTSYLTLYNVYLSRVTAPSEIIARYTEAQLRKERLYFVIVPTNEARSKVSRSVSYFGHISYQAWLTLPSYEIEALFRMSAQTDLHTYLVKGAENFLTIHSPTARVSIAPHLTFSGEAMLVNKTHIDLFCLGEPVE